jgi:hypothetical protein
VEFATERRSGLSSTTSALLLQEKEKMSHFYMILPSNSSSKFYPDNTLANYTTRLECPIALEGDWECALVEIIYPKSWYTIKKSDASFWVTCNFCEGNEEEYLSNTVRNPIFRPATYRVELRIVPGYYESMEDLLIAMNNAVGTVFTVPLRSKSVEKDEIRVDETYWPKFNYSERNRRVSVTVSKNMTIDMSPTLATILGIGTDQLPLTNTTGDRILTTRGSSVSDMEGGIHSMFVYCNILEHIVVGDTQAPLLCVVDTKGIHGETITKSFKHLKYVPLQIKQFDSIELNISDAFGVLIPFESGSLTTTLHFRKTVNPYFI